jgi:hypothetical protein
MRSTISSGAIRDGEAVLLDRLDLFVHVEMGGRQRAGAAAPGRPTGQARADRTGQHRVDRVGGEVERACAQHAADADGVEVAAHDERTRPGMAAIAAIRRSCCASQPGCQ